MRYVHAALLLVMAIPLSTSAQVIITEIMYDLREGSDSGREWIEVYNAGAAPIDLSTWKIVESGKNHKITAVQGSFGPGTFAVIADNAVKFKVDHPDYVGVLFDSAFSLNNNGERVALFDATGKEIVSAAYAESMGGNGTGDSLQMTPGGFMPGMSTPAADIPAGGLVLTPQVEKASKSKRVVAAAAAAPIVQEAEIPAKPRAQFAMVIATGNGNQTLWWLGTGVLATFAAAGIVAARRMRKTEWDIIEET